MTVLNKVQSLNEALPTWAADLLTQSAVYNAVWPAVQDAIDQPTEAAIETLLDALEPFTENAYEHWSL